MVVVVALQYYPSLIEYLPLFGYLRQNELILVFLKTHLIFTSAIGLNHALNENNINKLRNFSFKYKELLNNLFLPITISSFLFLGSIIFMYFDRRNIPSLYNVFANNSVYYYFSIKTLFLISLYLVFKKYINLKNKFIINLIIILAVIELSLNFVVLQYREDNFIDISRIENVRKITNLKDPIPTSKLDKFIDPLEKQFVHSQLHIGLGISTFKGQETIVFLQDY